jgi:hypothetical protein
VVGEVIGNYHPHGDSAVYDTLVRMAQDFSMRYPLIHGQGNFGSIDGDPPAAYRYTECRLNRLAEEMLADIEKNTVDMRPNFDETLQEPVVLPARLPNLLPTAAPASPSAWPPTSRRTTWRADRRARAPDRQPGGDVGDLMKFVKGPDFPTGGMVCGLGPSRDVRNRRGLLKVRGRAAIEEGAQGKESIIITEIPYTVNKATLIEKIAELVAGQEARGHLRHPRRVRQGRHPRRHRAEARRRAQGAAEQPLQVHPARDDLRRDHAGHRRRPPRVMNLKECCSASSITASRWSRAAPSSTSPRRGPRAHPRGAQDRPRQPGRSWSRSSAARKTATRPARS